jgi:hypothetical protein
LSCDNYNILIYINPLLNIQDGREVNKSENDIKKLEKMLDNFTKLKRIYKNITIINCTQSKNLLLKMFINSEGKEVFYKIVNVINVSIPQNIYAGTLYYNRNIVYEKDYLIRFVQSFNKTNKLDDTWWFKWASSVPPCARSRLTQSTGTCWMNSVINSLILTPKIKYTMIKEWYTNKKLNKPNIEILFNNFSSEKNTLNELLNSLIYNLFIKRVKAKSTDENFIVQLAARVKSIYTCNLFEKNICNKTLCNCNTNECSVCDINKYQFYYKQKPEKILYGDGGSTSYGLLVVFNNLFNENIYISYELNRSDLSNLFAPIFDKNINVYDFENKLKDIKNLVNRKINDNPQPIILITNTNSFIENVKYAVDEIIINGYKYKLEVSLIGLENKISKNKKKLNENCNKIKNIRQEDINNSGGHAICGISCNNKKYVYDSNNFISDDNWNKGNIDKYYNILIENCANYYYYDYVGLTDLIYIREDYPFDNSVVYPYNNINGGGRKEVKSLINMLDFMKEIKKN